VRRFAARCILLQSDASLRESAVKPPESSQNLGALTIFPGLLSWFAVRLEATILWLSMVIRRKT
jgi:hypothetical protein